MCVSVSFSRSGEKKVPKLLNREFKVLMASSNGCRQIETVSAQNNRRLLFHTMVAYKLPSHATNV